VSRFPKYLKTGEVAEMYVNEYTTIQSPLLLGPVLELGTKKDTRPAIQAWLKAHAEYLEPHLDKHAQGKDKLAKLAAQAQKSLR
jgi:hypothetical protein